MMRRLLANNKKEYLSVGKSASKRAEAELEEEGYKPKPLPIDDVWLLAVLAKANPVTRYQYMPEADRKRLRLAEGLNTARSLLNRPLYHEELRKFANLWYTQTNQYMIDTVDEATMDTYEAAGVKYAMWVTQRDGKVCTECRERDGVVYPIKNFPPKPHYNCRCQRRPMPKGYKPEDNS